MVNKNNIKEVLYAQKMIVMKNEAMSPVSYRMLGHVKEKNNVQLVLAQSLKNLYSIGNGLTDEIDLVGGRKKLWHVLLYRQRRR